MVSSISHNTNQHTHEEPGAPISIAPSWLAEPFDENVSQTGLKLKPARTRIVGVGLLR